MGGIVKGIFGGEKIPKVAKVPVPPPPIDDSAAINERNLAALDERRKRLAAGRGNNPTGGLGDESDANASVKSLLG